MSKLQTDAMLTHDERDDMRFIQIVNPKALEVIERLYETYGLAMAQGAIEAWFEAWKAGAIKKP